MTPTPLKEMWPPDWIKVKINNSTTWQHTQPIIITMIECDKSVIPVHYLAYKQKCEDEGVCVFARACARMLVIVFISSSSYSILVIVLISVCTILYICANTFWYMIYSIFSIHFTLLYTFFFHYFLILTPLAPPSYSISHFSHFSYLSTSIPLRLPHPFSVLQGLINSHFPNFSIRILFLTLSLSFFYINSSLYAQSV